MKRLLLALLLLPSLLFGQAANDLIIAQRNAAGTANVQRNIGIGAAGTVLTSNGAGVAPSMQAAAAGTVTSVSFTGGLISVATATTTPAFTVAGTSGGIPYFSAASTWATSAALAANSLVIGGGAGAAPSTTTTGSGVLTFLGAPSFTNLNSMLTGDDAAGLAANNSFSGVNTYAGSDIYTPVTITINEGAPDTGTIDITKGYAQATIDEATTFTPSAAGTAGQVIRWDVINAGASAFLMTVDTGSDFTFTAAASGTTPVFIRSNGSGWVLVGGSPTITDLSTITAVAADQIAVWDASAGVTGKIALSALPAAMALVEKICVFVVDGGGSAISTTTIAGTSRVKGTFTLTGYSITGTAASGTNTIKIWKVASGTAIPTIANVINTSGVSLTTGTAVSSTTVSDFTTATFTDGDLARCAITAVDGTATDLTVTLFGTRN